MLVTQSRLDGRGAGVWRCERPKNIVWYGTEKEGEEASIGRFVERFVARV